jgi:hypothetical protein
MIRWLLRNVLGAMWDELIAQLRAQLRPYLAPWEALDEAMREQEAGWA